MGRRGCHFSHGQNPVRSSSFRGLSLFRNHTETLATQARLDALGKTKVWKGGGGGGVWSCAHSHSFFTRVPHHELLSSLFWISFSYPVLHSCLNFGESHFSGVVKSRIPLKFPKSPHYTNPASQDHPSRSCKTFSATADLHHVVWLNSLCVSILCFWTDLICNNVVTSSSFFKE